MIYIKLFESFQNDNFGEQAIQLVAIYNIHKYLNTKDVYKDTIKASDGSIETYWYTKTSYGPNLIMVLKEDSESKNRYLYSSSYVRHAIIENLRECNLTSHEYIMIFEEALMIMFDLTVDYLKIGRLNKPTHAHDFGDNYYYSSEFDMHFGTSSEKAWTIPINEKSLVYLMFKWLDEGNTGTKLDFLEWSGKLKAKFVNGVKMYALPSSQNYRTGASLRGQLSVSFGELRKTGIFTTKMVGRNAIIIKGPNFEAFKKGQELWKSKTT